MDLPRFDTYRRLIKAITKERYPKDDIKYYLRPPASDNGFPVADSSLPKGFPIDKLEEVVRKAFAARGMRIVDEFFVQGSPEYPQDLSVFGFATIENYNTRVIGCVIASDLKVNGNRVRYINKFAVDPDYWGNHVGENLFLAVKETADEEGLPIILRTSTPQLDKMYGKKSDIRAEIDGFFIHGYEFMHTKRPLMPPFKKVIAGEKFEGAEDLFYKAAKQVAGIIRTAIPMELKPDYS